jgi:putative YhbY family RNA-binding protein
MVIDVLVDPRLDEAILLRALFCHDRTCRRGTSPVKCGMLTLSPGERRTLRAKAHHLHPVVSIGLLGLTPAVLHEIDVSLKAHELIKVRVWSDARTERDAMLTRICEELGAAAVQHLGKLLVVWRPAPKKEEAAPRRRNAASGKSAARKAPQVRRPRSPLPRTPAALPPRGSRGKMLPESPATPGSRRRTPFTKATLPAQRDDADPSRWRSRGGAGKAASRSNRRSTVEGSLKAAGRPAATPHGKSRSSSIGAAGARRRRRKAG